jgi:hypothetical protein
MFGLLEDKFAWWRRSELVGDFGPLPQLLPLQS